MLHITILSPCFNEESNVEEFFQRVSTQFKTLNEYSFDVLFIDNCSTDNTVQIITKLIESNSNIRLIVNSRNFGHIRSPYYGLLQTDADATILLASDLQDPPELIPLLLNKWRHGFPIVKAVKNKSHETASMYLIRTAYYKLLAKLTNLVLTEHYTGSGLYDRSIISIFKKINDPYPYFRGLVSDIGFDFAIVEFTQPKRVRGLTKNNFYTLYDMAMLGITNHSKVPLRIATFLGFLMSIGSISIGLVYFVLKIIYWERFQAGVLPIMLGIFFFGSVQLLFLGIIGEYIGNIHTQVQNRPLVLEKKRVNFAT
ncbi:MAG: glycosyltransferase family 2 protein [Pseudomonadota bacterium]